MDIDMTVEQFATETEAHMQGAWGWRLFRAEPRIALGHAGLATMPLLGRRRRPSDLNAVCTPDVSE